MLRNSIGFFLFLILLFQSTAMPICALENSHQSQDTDLISLLYQPDAVLTINTKGILNQTAPDFLNDDPILIAKLKKVMKLVEDETGVDPYTVNQIAMGLHVGKNKPENFIIALQINSSANEMAEKIFQNRSAHAKFSLEKSSAARRLAVLRVDYFSSAVVPVETSINEIRTKFSDLSAKTQEIQAKLADLRAAKASAPIIESLNQSANQISAHLKKISDSIDAKEEPDSFYAETEKLGDELEELALSDPQRVQKIAAIEKRLEQIEKASGTKNKTNHERFLLIETESKFPLSVDPLNRAHELLNKLSKTEPKRTQGLRLTKSSLSEFQKNLEQLFSEMQTQSQDTVDEYGDFSPKTFYVSKTEENIGGKKVLNIVSRKTFVNENLNSIEENSVAVYNDNILLIGKKESIAQALNKTMNNAERNNRMRTLLAKSPNSLLAFAADLENLDFSAAEDLFGEQTNVWQIYGGISAVSREITMSVSVEKSDIPMPVKTDVPKSSAKSNKIPFPRIGNNSAANDLLKLLGKTMIGAEGKFTVKFEKKKAAQLVLETPKILGGMINNNYSEQNSMKTAVKK